MIFMDSLFCFLEQGALFFPARIFWVRLSSIAVNP
jgi:hypothetical protein